MRIFAALALVASLAGPAQATQEYILPTLFDVAGVAADDVLNIRQQPDASSPVIGTLSPDARDVEVVQETRGWGRVNSGEASGWVSMRYLTYRTDVWEPGRLPAGFRCFGTEPFWSIGVSGDQIHYSEPERESAFPLGAILDSGVFRHPTRAVLGGEMTLVATPQLCSDGMSDRLFGLEASLIRHGERPVMLNGCCTIQP